MLKKEAEALEVGDRVLLRAGKHKGRKGTILKLKPSANRIYVTFLLDEDSIPTERNHLGLCKLDKNDQKIIKIKNKNRFSKFTDKEIHLIIYCLSKTYDPSVFLSLIGTRLENEILEEKTYISLIHEILENVKKE